MKTDLVINLIPISIPENGLSIYYSDTTGDDVKGTYRSIFSEEDSAGEEESDDKILWDINEFSGAQALLIKRPKYSATKRILAKYLEKYFISRGLTVGTDFIGGIKVLVSQEGSRHPEIKSLKEYSIRILSPKDQFICSGGQWCLNVSYLGLTEITIKPLTSYAAHDAIISKVVTGQAIRKLAHLTATEQASNNTHPIVSKRLATIIGISQNYYRSPNKYLAQYTESKSFYDEYLKGETISDILTVFESGFQPIPDSQLLSTSPDANLLVFGNNQTNVSPYNGLKSFGPVKPVADQNYRFIFVFHQSDKDYANNLYGFLKKGLKGYPGLFRFVGLDILLDTDKTITFTKDDPVAEVTEKLATINLDPNIKYIAIYISRISRDELDETKKAYYYKLKKAFLDKNISSQVVYKMNIEKPVFNYHLPNISIAILAKLGGIPWRLSRPIKNDLIIGVGAFREANNIFLGTTVAFRNDGSFVRFDSKKTNSTAQLAEYFHEIISTIAKEQENIKRVVIHYYKDMSHKEEKVIQDTLARLGLKIPYVVLTIVEDRDGSFTPFDLGYSGKMPTSGTCVVLKRGTYLLCNNTRYSESTGQKIDDFPFPVQLKISRSSSGNLDSNSIQELVDQVYQFSRMYWVSVKQKGRPVTVEYSARVAKLSAYFEGAELPNTDTAKRTLWFL